MHVRPIRPDDADRLVAFHLRQSPESIYYRYFTPKPTLTPAEVEGMVTIDLRGSLFCEVRETSLYPRCTFYASAISTCQPAPVRAIA